ncbi:hypothetical protein R75461_08307 [Paraburkholderia nemoris]|uniref:YaaC family protein n=1 Tax=Paraburkholderia nemoris TaxID=2793076 RepID=UPI00190B6F1B|nr:MULTISPECIES: hypothetical protein [Paraburkholderia]MBK3786981.1 hypothetical protein [Paraburkholderia aspalathi]CAE6866482.1 hypothetical protein R75461_08307 [Paraburkholderia nemoris]
MTSEIIYADDIGEALWFRLKRFASHKLCEKVILKRSPGISEADLKDKATGMAWAMRSALGYWETKSGGLNSRVLSRYYALLQISIAEQIALGDAGVTLASVQKHTEQGHGLFTLTDGEAPFPHNYLIGCLPSGHFAQYCRARGLDLKSAVFDKKVRKVADATQSSRFVSLGDLLCRVPELQSVTHEYLGRRPLSFHVGKTFFSETERQIDLSGGSLNGFLYDPKSGLPAETMTTAVELLLHGYELSAEEANTFGLPIYNFRDVTDEITKRPRPVGEVGHKTSLQWHDVLPLHKSGYCGTSVMSPFWGLTDIFTLHLTILYAFSIVVRYLPSLWHEIEDGNLDHLRALLEHYLVIVDNVLPQVALERVTGQRVFAVASGSLFGPT